MHQALRRRFAVVGAFVALSLAGTGAAVALTSGTHEASACTTASATAPGVTVPGHSVGVDGTEVKSLPGVTTAGTSDSRTVCVTATATDSTTTLPAQTTTVTVTAPTTTQQTTTSPPPPPPPPPTPVNNCTKVLNAGGDLAAFVASLVAGDDGCLHAGTYNAGVAINVSKTGPVTLESYPGETAVLTTQLDLGGSGVTIRNLTIQNTGGTASNAAIEITGTNQRVEHNIISHTAGHGILIHSDGTNSVVTRNYLSDLAYSSGNTQIHGIYVAGSGNTVSDNVVYHPSAYGIHLYTATSHDNVVAENTVVGSASRAGVLVDTTGANEKVVNNILVGNPTGGLLARGCGSGCVFDHTLGFNDGVDGTVTGAVAAQATNTKTADPLFAGASDFHLLPGSPAIDWSNPAFVFSPDLDGVVRPQGAAADSGAYER